MTPYWIPMFGVPCCECSYPAAFVRVDPGGRYVLHADYRLWVACSLPNPEHEYPLCPQGHVRSPDNVAAFGRCKTCITILSHGRAKGAA